MRAVVCADPRSRFHGLADADIQNRLEQDRAELDGWAVMMLAASFDATLQADAKDRIQARTRDDVRKPLRDLEAEHEGRVRHDDILRIWEDCAVVGATVKQILRSLLRHCLWLAQGRHWTNKHGAVPWPLDTHASLDDYVQVLQRRVPDFPRA